MPGARPDGQRLEESGEGRPDARAATSSSDSPPGAQTSRGSAPPAAQHVAPALGDLARGGGPPTRPGRSRRSRRRGGRARDCGAAGLGGSRPPRRRRSRPCAGAASGRSRAARRRGSGRMGGATRPGESRARRARAWRRPSSVSGVSAWPWNRPSTMNSDSPWRTQDERGVEARRDRVARIVGSLGVTGDESRSAVLPRRIVHRSRTASSARIARDGRRRTSSSSARIMNASARGAERARCIALMFTSASPRSCPIAPDRARPVAMPRDEHHVGRRPCPAGSRPAGRGAARRPRPCRRRSRCRRRPGREREHAAYAAARRRVLRSTT